MFILYDLIFLLFTAMWLPVYLLRRKFHPGFLTRLGFIPCDLHLEKPIWVHAVSVGEVMAIRGLLESLREIYPGKSIVISTVTPTGNEIARSMAKEGDCVIYLPLDFSFIVRAVINKIRPSLFVLAETEIWPNLIHILYKNKIPVVVVNARISDRSIKGYSLIKFLIKPILNKISAFCAQTETDAMRLAVLGVAKDKIQISGNMKFDLKPHVLSFDNINLGLLEDEQLLVCGSTHPGEEEIILRVYKNLLKRFPSLRLLIAPRHPERAKEISVLVQQAGFGPVFLSLLRTTNHELRTNVFILDTIGQLLNYYALADIVFVGGSLVKRGGHNVLEPAWQGKPILFGPHMFNFRDITDMFIKNKAGILVNSEMELEEKINYLLVNPDAADELSKRAKALIAQNQGATFRNSEVIKKAYARISL